jgi:hypothetical protein
VQGDGALAAQAGHLYLAAYLPGAALLVATALGVRRLAQLSLPSAPKASRARESLCWLLGASAGADLGLTWGAMSGLEVTLSTALVAWALATLLEDTRRGQLRWSLVWAALLPWARPELAVFAGAGVLWLLARALLRSGERGRRAALVDAGLYALPAAGGLALMALVYWWGWGRPLPSSFFAKVGGLRLGSRSFSAAQELLIAGRALPFVAGGLALVGGLAGLLVREHGDEEDDSQRTRWAAGILLLGSALFLASVMLSLPWFGQEDRYLLPLHPPVIVLLGMLPALGLRLLRSDGWLDRRGVLPVVGAVVGALLVGVNYVWATRQYAVEVRNIEAGHVQPALWIRTNTPADAPIAAEPIGAVRLFSGRRTIDLVGLTSPATLGTYADWPRAWPILQSEGARYLLFYPAWFDPEGTPAWATEVARFTIPDNRIVGDEVIAVYRLE